MLEDESSIFCIEPTYEEALFCVQDRPIEKLRAKATRRLDKYTVDQMSDKEVIDFMASN